MRALSLFSGGLDSLLSIKLMRLQGIEVTALYFDTGFGGRDFEQKKIYLERVVQQVDASLEIIDIKEQFVQEILFDPKFGYGKNFNPCIDCHANMFRIAYSMLERFGASFMISGEVVAQRPMSQRKEALHSVQNLSGAGELILRPLSAKILRPTKMELEGWVDREKLLGLSGRGRSTQMALAKEHNILEFESPAGGCLLTDIAYSQKIEEHLAHDTFAIEDIDVLKYGRQLRLPDGAKLVIGRDERENGIFETKVFEKYNKIILGEVVGPIGIVDKNASAEDISLALKLVLTYSRAEFNRFYPVFLSETMYQVTPFESKEVAQKYFVFK